jgi:hypothetical protein
MKILSLVHPLYQCIAFLVGAYSARMGLTRKAFTWRRHRSWGLLYYVMTTVGLVGGLLINALFERTGREFELGLHLPLGFLMVLLFVLAGALGFQMHRRRDLRGTLLPIHKYLNLSTLLLFVFQGLTGALELLGFFLA